MNIGTPRAIYEGKEMKIYKIFSLFVASIMALTLCACSSINGPTVSVMPAPGKTFERFKVEDRECRQFAMGTVESANNAIATSDVVTTLGGAAIGAVAGAMISGGSHAAVGTGAGIGLLGGAAASVINSGTKGGKTQMQYDQAYKQCMYAHGNQVPLY